MKQRFNAWVVSIAIGASLPAALAPIGAHASTAVNASWVQSSAQGPSPRAGVSLAYDTVNRHTVLFGGSPGSSYMSDTWTYDGSTWTQLQTSGPSARYLSPMAFDTLRGVAVLFGGYGDPGYLQDTWELSGSTWMRRFPQHAPPARDWSAMTYDSRRHVMVLFGGTGASGLLNDTWEYDGNDWTQVMPAHAPSPRRGMGLAFDSLRGKTVLYGGEADVPQRDTWEYDGVDWTQVVLPTSPNYRMWQGMAFDGALGVIVMFGGLEAGALNDETWIYDGSSWTQMQLAIAPGARFWAPLGYDSDRGALVLFGGTTAPGGPGSQVFGDTWSLTGAPTAPVDWLQINPAASPSPRAFSQMDYDSARGVTVLFGGSSDAGAANLADTWEWNGFNWAQMSPSVSPPALEGGSIAYDSGRGVSVLFGGDGSSGTSSSTWEWDGASWALRTPAVSPPATVFGAMSYDSARARMVLFGTSSNTWEYDGTTWKQIFPASSPSPRFGAAIAYDPTLRRTVLFGGRDANGQRLADTWEWDGSDWTQIATASAPHPRFWATMAFDAQRGRTVLFGGDHFQPGDFGESNDTWEWDGAQWTRDWPTAAPAIRSGQSMAYDAGRGRMVVFGGWNAATSPATIYGDTWEFGSGVPAATGTAAALGVFASGTDFGNVNVGSTSSNSAVFRLDSTGAGPLTVNAITYNGPTDFTMTTDCPVAGNPLPAGSYCVTLVSFTPASGGAKTATLSFDYNAPGGSQTFQLQGTGVLLPTALTVSPATAMYNGGATITAHLTANGSAFSGQSVTLTLPNGGTATTATDSSGIALFVGISLAGIHAGTYPTGIQAGFAGTPAYAPSSTSAQLTITQPVTTSYTGTFLVADNTPPKVALTVDQRTPASDPQFIDYSYVQVWARFTVSIAGGSTDFYGQVTDTVDWTASGLGVASATLPLLPDGAYTVTATLVGASGSTALSTSVAGDDARVGLAASPIKGGYLSGGGAIAADPSANTSDTHGYFSLELTPGSTPHGNVVYVYRVRMDVGGGNMRDVDVWMTSTDVTSLSGNGSSATATGHFSVAYIDSQTGQHYSAFEFTGGTFKLNEANSTSKSPAGISIVMQRPDGTIFHATAPVNAGGNAPLSPVVAGSLASHL